MRITCVFAAAYRVQAYVDVQYIWVISTIQKFSQARTMHLWQKGKSHCMMLALWLTVPTTVNAQLQQVSFTDVVQWLSLIVFRINIYIEKTNADWDRDSCYVHVVHMHVAAVPVCILHHWSSILGECRWPTRHWTYWLRRGAVTWGMAPMKVIACIVWLESLILEV